MVYLIKDTHQIAIDRSVEVYEDKYPLATKTGVTCFFVVIDNPTPTEAALVVRERDIELLTESEQGELKSEQYMIDNGWFPDSE